MASLMDARAKEALMFERIPGNLTAPVGGPDIPSALGPWRVALGVILLFLGGGGVWASFAPLASSVVASGTIQPDGRRRPVQASAAGVLADLRIRDGMTVTQGDVVAVLEDIRDRAESDAALQQLRQLAAQEARLEAERSQASSISFRHHSLADANDVAVAAILRGEVLHKEVRRTADTTRRGIFDQRIEQLNAQIRGTETRLQHVEEQLSLIHEEVADVVVLVQRGLTPRPRLLELQRRQAELKGTIGELNASIARLKQSVGETRLQLIELDAKRLEEITAQLIDTQTKRRLAEERLITAADKLTKTEIRAPVTGLPIGIKYASPGAVVAAGEVLLELVPQDDSISIEVRLRPVDIDAVALDAGVRIMFTGPANAAMRTVQGRLSHVAPDVLTDGQNQAPYYRATVIVPRQLLQQAVPGVRPIAGMPVQAFIDGPERTLLQYIAKPVTRALMAGMRER